tara:strand:- start:6119 stop:6340 length:222 start_codon:yes stop_codon:yes gene_type:complete
MNITMNDLIDYGVLSLTFLFTLFTDSYHSLLQVNLSPTILSDIITLITQIIVLFIVVFKFKLLKRKKDGDTGE